MRPRKRAEKVTAKGEKSDEAWNPFVDDMMFQAHFRAPPCPRKGQRPPETTDLWILVSTNSFLPERADTGRNGKELV